VVRAWVAQQRVCALHIKPEGLWENGYVDSFNGTLRDGILKREGTRQPTGVAGAGGAVAKTLQPGAAAQCAGVRAPGGEGRAAARAKRVRASGGGCPTASDAQMPEDRMGPNTFLFRTRTAWYPLNRKGALRQQTPEAWVHRTRRS
jgi:hypothetical protein